MRKYLLLLFIFCFVKTKANYLVKGIIIDASNKKPISFCNIVIKNKPTQGAVTNYKGYFSLQVSVGDTLITSYIGYNTNIFVIKGQENITIKLTKSLINLPEFTVSPTRNTLEAKQIVEKVRENWAKNHYQYNKLVNTEIQFSPNYTVFKNEKEIYNYTANNINLLGIAKHLFLNLKDTIYRKQKEYLPPSAISLQGGRPYFITNFIFFEPPVNRKYHFEFGTINYYQDQEVYQIKFHRKEGGGICEGGGYYLISTNNFSLIYCESVTRDCTGIDNRKEKLVWIYTIYSIFFNKNEQQKYQVKKIVSKVNYSYNNQQYYYKTNLVVDKITEGVRVNKQNLASATNVFYKKQILKENRKN